MTCLAAAGTESPEGEDDYTRNPEEFGMKSLPDVADAIAPSYPSRCLQTQELMVRERLSRNNLRRR